MERFPSNRRERQARASALLRLEPMNDPLAYIAGGGLGQMLHSLKWIFRMARSFARVPQNEIHPLRATTRDRMIFCLPEFAIQLPGTRIPNASRGHL